MGIRARERALIALPAVMPCRRARLVALSLVVAAAVLGPQAAQADWVIDSSRLSEVDACNKAQTLVPAGATVTAMQVRQFNDPQGYGFRCQVRWSTSPKAQPTFMPILFGPVWS